MKTLSSLIACALLAFTSESHPPLQDPRKEAERLLEQALERADDPRTEINIPHIVGPDDFARARLEAELDERLRERLGLKPRVPGLATWTPRDGAVSEDHPSGAPRVRGEVRGGLRDGPWLAWHEGGSLESQGAYARGKRHGAWTTWFPNGCVKSQGRYLYGRREGRWLEYHDTGALRTDATFVDGKRDGTYREWYQGGGRRHEGGYFDGAKHGTWRSWHPDGAAATTRAFRYGESVPFAGGSNRR